MPEARRIRPEERAAALVTIVAAFREDPQVRWWFPDDCCYTEFAERFFGVLLDTRMEGGEVWVDDRCRAVSLWVPPGGNLIGPERAASRYQAMVTTLPHPCGRRIRRTDDVVDRLLPTMPHWYLGVLACHPDHRGAGLGAAVAAPMLAAADRAGQPVVLETGNPGNIGYYTRRGFAVVGRAQLEESVVVAGAQAPGAGMPRHVMGASRHGASSEPPEVTVHVMLRQPRG